MPKCVILMFLATVLWCQSRPALAQNWIITIQDIKQGTPIYQVNGVAGGTAVLYASIENFTGTSSSDDGTGSPAPSTVLDFAGFGFTQNPGQVDIGSRFTPDPRIPGYPQVAGSPDGINFGNSSFVSLGSFDLSGLVFGLYQEDFVASAYADDLTSPIIFGDVTGTLSLSVAAPSAVPEASSMVLALSVAYSLGMAALSRSRNRKLLNPRVWIAYKPS